MSQQECWGPCQLLTFSHMVLIFFPPIKAPYAFSNIICKGSLALLLSSAWGVDS